MYNFGVNAGLSATAVLNVYDRLVNVLVGMITLPFLFMIGFIAIQSDFAKVKPISSGNNSYMLVSDNNSIGSINQKQDIKLSEYSGGSGIGDICGKGMILFPMIPDEMFVGYSSKINSDKRKGITFDSTIYLSIEMVDKAPELIWMVYPNLVKTGSANLSSVQVTLSILVDYSGKALEVAISGETMIDQNTKQTVLESARTSLFKPAQKNNQSVKCWVQVPMEFEIDA